jgi:co-chaperonin GroES (HSP10)
MKPRLLKSSQLGEFVPAEYSGRNESGYVPIGDRVLVLPDTAAAQTSGGIHLTPDAVERTTLAAESGVIVALGDGAFHWAFDGAHLWNGPKPQAGDRVYVERYSGQVMLGEDGKFYRLMDAKCIGAVRSGPPAEPVFPTKMVPVTGWPAEGIPSLEKHG